MQAIIDKASQIILGKELQVKLALTCLLARGHLLIEDLPGMGKTTLAHFLAAAFGLRFARIQFTSDLLPADILGISIYEKKDTTDGQFIFHHGPIFNQLLLADEINRSSPKTQSALLEAMEEHQVSVDGETRALPEPFFVIATQNPQHHLGTFPLPESQLDRFLFCINMDYPNPDAERLLLQGEDRKILIENLGTLMNHQQLLHSQQLIDEIHASDALIDYIQALLAFSRNSGEFIHGLSPRAGLGLLRAARAFAYLSGRKMVLPEDVQAVLAAVVNHRLQHATESNTAPSDILLQVAIP